MQPQLQDALFSFTVPPKSQSQPPIHHPCFILPYSHHHLSPILTNPPPSPLHPSCLDLDHRSPTSGDSISPIGSSSTHRPSTANGLFAYHIPPSASQLSPGTQPRPISSCGLPSTTTTTTTNHNTTTPLQNNQTPPLARSITRISQSSLSSASPNSFRLLPAPPPPTGFQYGIGPHNTRPMTAPGAGWDAGKFNHDYDYTSASVGLYGNSPLQFSSPDITTPTPTSNSTILTHQTESSPTSTSSDQLLSLFPSFAPPASSIRPNTHAGTQLSFSDRPQSSYNQTQSNSSSYEPWRPNLNGLGIDHCHPSESLIGSDRPYQFNLLPGAPRKRARRRFDEVERLYQCNYPGCTKAYGTLNHLNAHICMQKHGPKRLPQEFKEIRKEWRAKKKAEAEARNAGLVNNHNGSCWNGPSISSNITTTTT